MNSANDKFLKIRALVLLVFFMSGACNMVSAQPLNVIIQGQSNVSLCSGYQHTIQTSVTGGTPPYTYSWSPGGATTPSITVIPVANTTYSVTVTDLANNTDFASVNIWLNPSPTAGFTFSPDSACSGNVSFTNTSTTQQGIGITGYSWNFGDGSPSVTSMHPVHNYTSIGAGYHTFSCTLVVTNIYSCRDTIIHPVTIKQSPDVSIVDALNNPCPFSFCPGTGAPLTHTLTIFNNSSTTATNTLYHIDWGDASQPYSSPVFPATGLSHTYSGIGYFYITVTITGSNGCTASKTCSYFYGSNPGIGIGIPDNTTGQCIPPAVCFNFPITYYNNTPGTTYQITSNGINSPITYTHPSTGSPPSIINICFNNSSCGATSQYAPDNTFYVRIIATNGCGPSTGIVEPITTSTKPQTNFSINPTPPSCLGQITFTNTSISGEVVNWNGSNYACNTTSMLKWEINPPTGWTIASGNPFPGSNSLVVDFTTPGVYQVTLINTNQCGSDTIIKPVCVRPTVTAGFTANTYTGCTPLVVNLTNTTDDVAYCNIAPSYTWEVIPGAMCAGNTAPALWYFSSGTTLNSRDPVITFVTPGSYTLRLTVTNVCGAPLVITQTITVLDKPFFSMPSPSGQICEGDPVLIPSPTISNCWGAPYSYSWTFQDGTPATSTALNPGSVSFSPAGNKIISLAITNSCGSTLQSGPVEVVNPASLVINPSGTIIVCKNDPPFQLTVLPNGSGSWTCEPGYGLSMLDTLTGWFTPSIPGTHKIIHTRNYGNCQSIDSVVIIINDLPYVNLISVPTNICLGDTVTLVATGTATNSYWWNCSNPGCGLTFPVAGSIASVIPSASGNYTYTVEGIDNFGCSDTATATITVHPLPVVYAGSDTTVCLNSNPFPLTGAFPAGGFWTGVIIGNLFHPLFVGTDMVTYIYTDGYGCTNSDMKEIIVVPGDSVSATPTDTAVCLNDPPFYLLGTPTGGTWSGTTTQSNSMVNANTGLFTPSAVGTFYLVYTRFGLPCVMSDTLKVTVHPLPNVIVNPSSASICIGGTINLTAQGANNYLWQHDNSTVGTVSVTPSSVGQHTYPVVGTDGNGCKNTGTAMIQVHPLPTVNAGPDDTICTNSYIYNLPAGLPPGGSWSGSNIIGNQLNISVAGNYMVTYSYTNTNSCTNTDTLIVTAMAPVSVTAIPSDTVICQNSLPLQLTGLPSGGTWKGNFYVDSLTGVFIPTSPGTYISVYSFNSGYCISFDTVTITVNPIPDDAGVIAGDTLVCQGQDSLVYYVSPISNSISYVWTLPTGATGSSSTNMITVDYGTNAVSGHIAVHAVNACGAGVPASSYINVNQKPPAPTVTQNGNTLLSDAPLGNQWHDQNGAINGETGQQFTVVSNGHYYTVVTLLGCSSDPSNIVSITTDIKNYDQVNGIRIYPNPVSDELVIESSGIQSEIFTEISDMIGNVVYRGTFLSKAHIQTSGISPGLYILRVESNGIIKVMKIIKN